MHAYCLVLARQKCLLARQKCLLALQKCLLSACQAKMPVCQAKVPGSKIGFATTLPHFFQACGERSQTCAHAVNGVV